MATIRSLGIASLLTMRPAPGGYAATIRAGNRFDEILRMCKLLEKKHLGKIAYVSAVRATKTVQINFRPDVQPGVLDLILDTDIPA